MTSSYPFFSGSFHARYGSGRGRFCPVPRSAECLKDIFARFVAGADAEGHAVVRGRDLGEEAVKGGEIGKGTCGTP